MEPMRWGCFPTPQTQKKEVRNLTSHFDTTKLGKVTKMNPKWSPRDTQIRQKLVKNLLWLQGVSFGVSWAAPAHQNEPKAAKMIPQGPENIGIGSKTAAKNAIVPPFQKTTPR